MKEKVCMDCGWIGDQAALAAGFPGDDEHLCPECGSDDIEDIGSDEEGREE